MNVILRSTASYPKVLPVETSILPGNIIFPLAPFRGPDQFGQSYALTKDELANDVTFSSTADNCIAFCKIVPKFG